MSVITLAETKEFLRISASTYDSIITSLIPTVQDRLRYICNNPFTVQPLINRVHSRFGYYRNEYDRWYDRDTQLYILAQVNATFDASSATVTSRGENFASAQFASGMDILIKDSYRNDGYFTIDSVSTSSLTIASTFSASFNDEATGATIYFAVVNWPKGIKPLVAQLIRYDYEERPKLTGVRSERLGPYSVSYGVDYGYPKALLAPLMEYTIPHFGAMTQ